MNTFKTLVILDIINIQRICAVVDLPEDEFKRLAECHGYEVNVLEYEDGKVELASEISDNLDKNGKWAEYIVENMPKDIEYLDKILFTAWYY